MEKAKGFWSYVHADDEAEGGRVSKLANDISKQYEMITGERIKLFIDKDGINWGDNWKNGIDSSLSSTAYFIAIITPRYFTSIECRRELNSFAQQAKEIGVQELILPLLYVDVPELHKDNPQDELMVLVKDFHWHDWRELRFSPTDSSEYRRGVADLAQNLAERNRKIDSNSIDGKQDYAPVSTNKSIPATDNNEPGILDTIATMELVIPEWVNTLESITTEITLVGNIFTDADKELNVLNKTPLDTGSRIKYFKKLSNKLLPVSRRISVLGSKFNGQLYEVDTGVRYLVPAIAKQKDMRGQADSFFTSIRGLDEALGEGIDQLELMLKQMEPIEALSRDLRKPLRDIRKGLTYIVEGREVVDEWVKLIDLTEST